jgi:signal recognition particle subunit SRP54
MFENLTRRLEAAFKSLRSKGVLTEKDVKAGLREVRLALLEADVHYGLAKQIVRRVEEKALGQEILESLSPFQQLFKVLRDELVDALGGEGNQPLQLGGAHRSAVMLVGLQGAGKTTTAAKLARRLRRDGRTPLLVSTDVRRPAARDQLDILGAETGIPVWREDLDDPVRICRKAWKGLKDRDCDTLVVDTAGRLHVDDELMEELRRQKDEVRPEELLLVADAMTGQDALRSAEAFQEAMGLTGVVLTKLDTDARGGAVLSLRHATGVPVRFVGTGERLEDLEPFQAERMVSRILGRGDMMTLIEKAEEAVAGQDAQDLQKKVLKGEGMNLEDFLAQLKAMRKMGPLGKILEMLPGAGKMKDLASQVDESKLRHVEAIILSMTPEERRRVGILNNSRKRRIARGAGRPLSEVNGLIRQFHQMNKMVKKFGKSVPGGAGMPGLPRGFRR